MDELNPLGGVLGIVGLALTLAGATASQGVPFYTGLLIIIGSFAYAGYRAFPPALLALQDNVGRTLQLRDLNDLFPLPLKLGIVGASGAGKSTFLTNACHRAHEHIRTNRVSATIMALQTAPVKYIALIDGDGARYAQQFEIADAANYLLIFMDHDVGDSKIAPTLSRKTENEQFIHQLVSFCLQKNKRFDTIVLLLNKRDLWERSKASQDLEQWLSTQEAALRVAAISTQIISRKHSNNIAGDISSVVLEISNHGEEHA